MTFEARKRRKTAMITFKPGVYPIAAMLSVADLRGDAIVDPALGTLEEQLRCRREPPAASRHH